MKKEYHLKHPHDKNLNPKGKEPNVFICESLGHMWNETLLSKRLQVNHNDYGFKRRDCKRCDRTENWINGDWVFTSAYNYDTSM